MFSLPLIVLTLFIGVGFLMPLLPKRFAAQHPASLGRLLTGLLAAQFVLTISILCTFLAQRWNQPQLSSTSDGWILKIMNSSLIYFDSISGLMCGLVAFVGMVVAKYSIRYLNGETTQGQFFQRLAFSISSVSLMVLSGNFAVTISAWIAVSFGLHGLLTHYHSRPLANQAAQTKFVISRIGDAFLLASAMLLYRDFGTLDFATIFNLLEDQVAGNLRSAAPWTLMIAAAMKSAQFPFHVWLPGTLETPTPVSAMMHAGIVNAGGFLLIRLSPIMALAPEALLALAIVGTITAIYGGIVMMAQPSVKRALAYSTIGQMGFMMLQIGLGAFAAAMLHILAHSLYKAYSFLNSGTVEVRTPRFEGTQTNHFSKPQPISGFRRLTVASAALIVIAIAASLSSILPVQVPMSSVILSIIFFLALLFCTVQVLATTPSVRSSVLVRTVLPMGIGYVVSLAVIRWIVSPDITSIEFSNMLILVGAVIATSFLIAFYFQANALFGRTRAWIHRIRIHAANGFYAEALYRRFILPLMNS